MQLRLTPQSSRPAASICLGMTPDTHQPAQPTSTRPPVATLEDSLILVTQAPETLIWLPIWNRMIGVFEGQP
eukprot:15460930-Alexandrium_andersonii.AAC.1